MFLEKILSARKLDIEKLKKEFPLTELKKAVLNSGRPNDFYSALTSDVISIIAECKKASPSKGILIEEYTPAKIAAEYEKAGAKALSVLTEPGYFLGSSDDISNVKKATSIPILMKDFIIDEYQIYQGRSAGADAILLIVRILEKKELEYFLSVAESLDMAALVEVHNENELNVALSTSAKAIGINNRDLQTFEIDLTAGIKLAAMAKKEDRIIVAESGIKNKGDIDILKNAGVDAVLIGETLLKSNNIGAKMAELMGLPRPLGSQ